GIETKRDSGGPGQEDQGGDGTPSRMLYCFCVRFKWEKYSAEGVDERWVRARWPLSVIGNLYFCRPYLSSALTPCFCAFNADYEPHGNLFAESRAEDMPLEWYRNQYDAQHPQMNAITTNKRKKRAHVRNTCACMMYVPHTRHRTIHKRRAKKRWSEKENIGEREREDERKRKNDTEREEDEKNRENSSETNSDGDGASKGGGEHERKRVRRCTRRPAGSGSNEDRASRGGGWLCTAERKERLRKRNGDARRAEDAPIRTGMETRGGTTSVERERRSREYGTGVDADEGARRNDRDEKREKIREEREAERYREGAKERGREGSRAARLELNPRPAPLVEFGLSRVEAGAIAE
ncbi:hypothetical protein ALC57_11646, partial [Trachymyrmex cornetzi]